jgi:hypothetical protein
MNETLNTADKKTLTRMSGSLRLMLAARESPDVALGEAMDRLYVGPNVYSLGTLRGNPRQMVEYACTVWQDTEGAAKVVAAFASIGAPWTWRGSGFLDVARLVTADGAVEISRAGSAWLSVGIGSRDLGWITEKNYAELSEHDRERVPPEGGRAFRLSRTSSEAGLVLTADEKLWVVHSAPRGSTWTRQYVDAELCVESPSCKVGFRMGSGTPVREPWTARLRRFASDLSVLVRGVRYPRECRCIDMSRSSPLFHPLDDAAAQAMSTPDSRLLALAAVLWSARTERALFDPLPGSGSA